VAKENQVLYGAGAEGAGAGAPASAPLWTIALARSLA
jgi:hypothetical protein